MVAFDGCQAATPAGLHQAPGGDRRQWRVATPFACLFTNAPNKRFSVFKNMIVYRIAPQWQVELTQVEEALAKAPFMECGATQEKSLGWVPPRGDAHGPLAESVGGQWILRFMVESKVLPGSVLARKVKEKAERIEQETGRKPGKKESKELKDEAKLDLLPMAFTKQGSMWIWIDTTSRLLVLDTSSQGRADEVVTLLVESLPGLSVSLLDTQTSPQAAMAHWLKEQEPPVGFTVDRECELKAANEEKSVVKYGRHALDIEEVKGHIEAGKLKAIGVSGERRMGTLPNVPSLAEQGLNDEAYRVAGWLAFGAPAGTPPAIQERIAEEVRKATQLPDVAQRIAAMGFDVQNSSPALFSAAIAKERPVWERLIKASGAKLD
eukprot:gene40462-53498_t